MSNYSTIRRKVAAIVRLRILTKLTVLLIYIVGIFLIIRLCIPKSVELNFSASSIYSVSEETDTRWTEEDRERFEKWIANYERGVIIGLGDDGKLAKLVGEDEIIKAKAIMEEKFINIPLSNRIPLNRKLPDFRHPLCRSVAYDKSLSSASVIIIFHNEPWSLLMRTVWSVLDRTPVDLLKEIILVDDYSDDEDLQDVLDYYISTRLPLKVKLMRLGKRVGLIRARLRGARKAAGDVLVFLDAHCEVTIKWLEPQLQRIKEERSAVVTPSIDTISQETLQYYYSYGVSVYGFSWDGYLTIIEDQQMNFESQETKIRPVKSPTMAGGLFAIDRRYFWEIGSYDDQMDGWGGENLEMSFRIWQCGGSIETIPCSRVGHIFRPYRPYKMPNDRDTHGINTARLVSVWWDEYKRLFFMFRGEYKNNTEEIGDLSERLALRKALKCKSFKWYLDNVYPEQFIPDENVLAYGRLQLIDKNVCVDDLQRTASSNLGLNQCHSKLSTNQFFSLTNAGELRKDKLCAIVEARNITANQFFNVKMENCKNHGNDKKWIWSKDGYIVHSSSRLCLDAIRAKSGADVHAVRCRYSSSQRWQFHNNYSNDKRDN